MGRGPAWSASDIALLAQARADGLSAGRIHKKFGWPISSIKKMMKKVQLCVEAGEPYPTSSYSARAKTVVTDELVNKVKENVDENAHKSIREMHGEAGGPSMSSVYRAYKARKTPFKQVHGQHLTPEHMERRKIFCMHLLQRIRAGRRGRSFVKCRPLRLSQLVFEDEKFFRLVPNKASKHVWVDKHLSKKEALRAMPTTMRTTSSQKQRLQGLMVSAALTSRTITSPTFVPPGLKIDGNGYVDVLKNEIFPKLQGSDESLDSLVFVHDSAPSHSSKVCTAFLAGQPFETLKGWPANSPDLNPCDYFLWGAMQHHMRPIKEGPEAYTQLRAEVQRAYIKVMANPEALKRAVEENFEKRLRLCAAADGGHFEGA